jgi:hypothetical protein
MAHGFLHITECPVTLMGQDLLSKLQAQVSFQEDGQAALSFGSGPPRGLPLITPQREEWRLHSLETALKGSEIPLKVPGVWAENNPLRLAVNIPPMVIEINPRVTLVRVKQYPILMRAQEGIYHHLQRLLNYGILRPCQYAWNTPFLPVQKPGTNDYRPVQDLGGVNQAAVTAPGGSKPVHLAGTDTSRSNLLLMFERKKCILLHTVVTCEPTHLCFPMGGPPVMGATAVNLDLSPTGFQKLLNHLWNYSGIRFLGIASRRS